MGNQANSPKARYCEFCRTRIRNVTAAEMKEHARGCAEDLNMTSRLEAIGLSRPKMTVESAELLEKQKRLPPNDQWSLRGRRYVRARLG